MKAKTWAVGSVLTAAILSVAPARASIIIQSYWQMGEGANAGVDSSSANDGEVNNFNQYATASVQTATPSGVNGSTPPASFGWTKLIRLLAVPRFGSG